MSDFKQTIHDISDLDKDIKIAFISSEFNRKYTKELEEVNSNFLNLNGFENIDYFLVPGAFELPGLTRKVLDTDNYDLIIVFGVVVRGETPHFDYVCNECSRGIMDLTISYDTPIIFGVLTCNTFEQVETRISDSYAISGLNLLSEAYKI